MRLLADKLAAKRTMKKFGIPSLPGGDAPLSEDIDESRKEAAEIGYPVLIKAAHGGGGRGMRVVHTEAALPNAIATLRAEAANAFGNDALYMERLLENPRHIEVQILADRHRGVVHLGTRECSVQRRHQKIAEEAPGAASAEKNRQRRLRKMRRRLPQNRLCRARELLNFYTTAKNCISSK